MRTFYVIDILTYNANVQLWHLRDTDPVEAYRQFGNAFSGLLEPLDKYVSEQITVLH